RHPPDPPRHPDDGQHGGRALPPAGRAQSLRRVWHRQDGYYRADHRGVAVVDDDADLPGDGDLHPGAVAVAAATAGDDVAPGRRRRVGKIVWCFLSLGYGARTILPTR